MKILVIGGSGFIGSRLTNQLSIHGHSVHPVDIAFPPHVDVVDEYSINKAIVDYRPDVIYHTAAIMRSEECRHNPTHACDVNLQGLSNTLKACVDANVKRFIFSSTVHVYAATDDQDVHEDTILDVNKPIHIYPYTKIAGEMLIKSFQYLYNLPYTILRYGIVYGPGGHDDMVVHSFVKKCMNKESLILEGEGASRRNFVYITDLIDGNVRALAPEAENETINLCGDTGTSVKEISDTVQAVVGRTAVQCTPKRVGDFDGVNVSNKKAKKLIGWAPTVNLEEGIIKYYNEQNSNVRI